MSSLDTFIDRLQRDVAAAGLIVEVAIFDLHERRWLTGGGLPPEGFGDEGFVITLPGRSTAIHRDASGDPDRVGIIDRVQDSVIDELGVGWPELVSEQGEYVGILSPSAQGVDVGWSAPHGAKIPVGDLDDASTRPTSGTSHG